MRLCWVVRLGNLLCLAFVACGFHAAEAQSTRADAASRTAAALGRTQAATEVVAQADAELGTLEPIRPRPSLLGAYLIGNASLYYTSNPSLSNDGGRGDLYFVGGGGVGIRPNLIGGLYLDGHVSDQVFQYATFSALNFNYFNAGGGFDYVFEQLGQLTASIRYEYQRYLDDDTLDEFYVNNALTLGLYKAFQIHDAMWIQAGWLGSLSLDAQPSSARRHEYDFWVGWRWRILTPLELQTYYILSLFHYPQDSRFDVTHNVGAASKPFVHALGAALCGDELRREQLDRFLLRLYCGECWRNLVPRFPLLDYEALDFRFAPLYREPSRRPCGALRARGSHQGNQYRFALAPEYQSRPGRCRLGG